MASDSRKESREVLSPDDDSEPLGSDWELETGNEEQYRTRPRQHGILARLRRLLPSTGSRTRILARPLNSSGGEDHDDVARWQQTSTPRSKLWVRWLLWRIPISILCCFGLLHIIIVSLARKSAFWDRQPVYAPDWGKPGNPGDGLAEYPTEVTRDVLPIPCHSHNDYWRRVPLFEALHWGCTGVEADVWQMDGEDELLVGHSRTSLTKKRTFTSLYVNPLVELIDGMNPTTAYTENNSTTINGVFDTDPDETLVLLVDFKTDGHNLFPVVEAQLQALRDRDYISHWNGTAFNSRAITVVGTGNAPFDMIIANETYRDIFFDAPIDIFYDGSTSLMSLRRRGQGSTGTAHTTAASFNASNSYYASVSFDASIGLPYGGGLSSRQIEMLRGQIAGAHERGLKARYWDTPAWPTSLRNHVWKVLVEEGTDMLNVDDLEAAAKRDWGLYVQHGWYDG